MTLFIIGQRWISESEPELGLATVVHAGSGRVQVEFKSAGEMRTYATEHAPLKRVRFRTGDKVRTQEDKEFFVTDVIEQEGLLTYVGENQRLPEAHSTTASVCAGRRSVCLLDGLIPRQRSNFVAARLNCSIARASPRCADSSVAALI